MSYPLIAAILLIVNLVLITFVVEKYGTGDKPATNGEVLVLAILWATTAGTALFLHPAVYYSFSVSYNPAIPVFDKILLWVHMFLHALVVIRTFAMASPLGRKIITALLGTFLTFFLFFMLVALFGVRTYN